MKYLLDQREFLVLKLNYILTLSQVPNCWFVDQEVKEGQKLNHFPGTFNIGRKDKLWRNYHKLMLKFGKSGTNEFIAFNCTSGQPARSTRA